MVRRRGVDETRVSVITSVPPSASLPPALKYPITTQLPPKYAQLRPITHRCKTLFATHAERLRDLSRIYPNVRSSAMAVDLRSNPHERGGNRGGIECRYR